jgi:hypothetical protein
MWRNKLGALCAVIGILAVATVAKADGLAVSDVFAFKDDGAVALADSEMQELRGGMGLAFSVFWSARMENLTANAGTSTGTSGGGEQTPEEAFNSAVTLQDGEGKVSAFFGNVSGFNGIIQNIQAAGGSNNVFTNIMNIQVFLVTVATQTDIPMALNTILSRF